MNLKTIITRETSFDAGHRLMHHGSKCSHLHGHRFRVEAGVSGAVNPATGLPDEGMVLDFGEVKNALLAVAEELDHAFIADARDVEIIDLCKRSQWRLVIMDCPPTAENIALRFFESLRKTLSNWEVEYVRVWETPNNSATVTKDRLFDPNS